MRRARKKYNFEPEREPSSLPTEPVLVLKSKIIQAVEAARSLSLLQEVGQYGSFVFGFGFGRDLGVKSEIKNAGTAAQTCFGKVNTTTIAAKTHASDETTLSQGKIKLKIKYLV